ncbi:Flp pilus assembly protein CpaB [Nesterenkonia aerolata]|uniref:Flp pilus assembly protein CpaB n=1 Tax=Nesterenkonia aerolata TaxID=3074079 RepID=A0ABU2DUG3_9MICC|nr:Flp pilus assembly protein CpaB [Nesterenkonia sp. LY-0111]MDR8020142.1 Flp pilus assembly protein CpaB [Nesterenkonia sp. LY-0111]
MPALKRGRHRGGHRGRRRAVPRGRRLVGSPLRLWVRRLRLPLLVGIMVCAGALGALAVADDPEELVDVVQVTSAVPAGEELSAGTLQLVEVDRESVAEDAVTDVEELSGRRSAVPLAAGAVVAESHLVGSGLLAQQPDGTVAVPVRAADSALVTMLSPGQRVDVLSSTDGAGRETASETLADSATVLWTPTSEDDSWLASSAESGDVVIVAVDPETAEDIARAAHQGRLHLSLVG